jgi:hypothetical protein
MSTRACYRFFPLNGPNDWPGVVTVYKHHDGYPAGAAQAIEAALDHAWSLPRFEPDEFAAGFVTANKYPHSKSNQRRHYEDLAAQASAAPTDGCDMVSYYRKLAETAEGGATFVWCLTKVSTPTSVSPVISPTSTISGARTGRSALPRTRQVNAMTCGRSRGSSKAASNSSPDSSASPSHPPARQKLRGHVASEDPAPDEEIRTHRLGAIPGALTSMTQ